MLQFHRQGYIGYGPTNNEIRTATVQYQEDRCAIDRLDRTDVPDGIATALSQLQLVRAAICEGRVSDREFIQYTEIQSAIVASLGADAYRLAEAPPREN